jgi:hypothetical protein
MGHAWGHTSHSRHDDNLLVSDRGSLELQTLLGYPRLELISAQNRIFLTANPCTVCSSPLHKEKYSKHVLPPALLQVLQSVCACSCIPSGPEFAPQALIGGFRNSASRDSRTMPRQKSGFRHGAIPGSMGPCRVRWRHGGRRSC